MQTYSYAQSHISHIHLKTLAHKNMPMFEYFMFRRKNSDQLWSLFYSLHRSPEANLPPLWQPHFLRALRPVANSGFTHFSKYQVPCLLNHTYQLPRCPHLIRKKEVLPSHDSTRSACLSFCLFYFMREFLRLVPTSNSLVLITHSRLTVFREPQCSVGGFPCAQETTHTTGSTTPSCVSISWCHNCCGHVFTLGFWNTQF